MSRNLYIYVLVVINANLSESQERPDPEDVDELINVIDMTRPTTWTDMYEHFQALEKKWKICLNCGIPRLGTGMHLEHSASSGSMYPAVIPSEFLLTRLTIIDVSKLAKQTSSVILTLDVALQWIALKHDPQEPTLLLFKFGWTETTNPKIRSCVCNTPGLSYELAEWIAANLSHVVGVATDAPTLESQQTREFLSRTVSNLLGKSGIYMIENVNMKRRIPEQGCMAIAMPLKMLNTYYVPTRLTAFCPMSKTDRQVVVAMRKVAARPRLRSGRIYDVNLEEILRY